MGNSASKDYFNKSQNYTLENFQEETKRKMTIHLLSNNPNDCIKFIEFFTNEKMGNSKKLLEKDIKKKINLYSFMNYIIYENASELIEVIEKKVNLIFSDPKSNEIYSEVVIVLDNDEIIAQINEIKNKFLDNDIMQLKPYFIPFLIIISPKQIDLSDFLLSKTFQYKITLENIFAFLTKIKEEKKKKFLNSLEN